MDTLLIILYVLGLLLLFFGVTCALPVYLATRSDNNRRKDCHDGH